MTDTVVMSIALVLLLTSGCSERHTPESAARSPADAQIATDASVPDSGRADASGQAQARDNDGDSGARPTQLIKVAKAELTGLGPDSSLSGTATWQTTVEGIDMMVVLSSGCAASAYTLEILEASDCEAENLQAPQWRDGRGSTIPDLYCGLGRSTLVYSRSANREDAWSIGEGADSELQGRILVVRDVDSAEPVACGAITRALDSHKPLPPTPADAKEVEAFAGINAICLARQFPNTSPSCPDPAGLLQCANVHCDTAECVEQCDDYTQCLKEQGDICTLSECTPSEACSQCQDALYQCDTAFCGKHLTCAPAISPNGPCQKVAFCCALQGEQSNSCLGLLAPLTTSFGGDANCVGSMNDWDVLSHMHVPCTYNHEPTESDVAPTELPVSKEPRLEQGAVGKACEDDAQCPGGFCEHAASSGDRSLETGYCSRACMASSECGPRGICVALPSDGGTRRCLAECDDSAQCLEGFICAGGMRGATLNLPGSCRPASAVGQLEDAVAGRACEGDAACPGGECAQTNLLGTRYPGNYCTAHCYDDLQCGQGGVCLWPKHSVDAGYCLQRCDGHDDCTREGYRCWQFGDGQRIFGACYPGATPLPDHTVGTPCTQDLDCGAEQATCAQELPYGGLVTDELTKAVGGYCTSRCALDSECGGGSQCINYGVQGGICLATCTQSAQCRDGYTCLVHDRDHDAEAGVCVPKEGGS